MLTRALRRNVHASGSAAQNRYSDPSYWSLFPKSHNVLRCCCRIVGQLKKTIGDDTSCISIPCTALTSTAAVPFYRIVAVSMPNPITLEVLLLLPTSLHPVPFAKPQMSIDACPASSRDRAFLLYGSLIL